MPRYSKTIPAELTPPSEDPTALIPKKLAHRGRCSIRPFRRAIWESFVKLNPRDAGRIR